MEGEETASIVDAATAQIEAAGAAASAEAAAEAAAQAEQAVTVVEQEAQALANQRHSELVASYEARIAELETWKMSSTEILSQLRMELSEATTALRQAMQSSPASVAVQLMPTEQQEQPPTESQSTLIASPEATAEIEQAEVAEREPRPAPRKRRRIL